jgi:hypothetical protein
MRPVSGSSLADDFQDPGRWAAEQRVGRPKRPSSREVGASMVVGRWGEPVGATCRAWPRWPPLGCPDRQGWLPWRSTGHVSVSGLASSRARAGPADHVVALSGRPPLRDRNLIVASETAGGWRTGRRSCPRLAPSRWPCGDDDVPASGTARPPPGTPRRCGPSAVGGMAAL